MVVLSENSWSKWWGNREINSKLIETYVATIDCIPWEWSLKKNRMQLFGDVQSSFRSTLHCNCSQWLEPLELFLCGSRHFTISSHQTRPKAILPIFGLAAMSTSSSHSFFGKKTLSLCWSSFKSMEKTQQQTIPMDEQQIANLNSLVVLGLV